MRLDYTMPRREIDALRGVRFELTPAGRNALDEDSTAVHQSSEPSHLDAVCTVCRVNFVDVDAGFDTCASCMRRI